MTAPQFTPGPWKLDANPPFHRNRVWTLDMRPIVALCSMGMAPADCDAEAQANARLIAAAPDHALICWAMCVQDARWEEWVPFDGKGEFCFAGLKYATSLDEFGCPRLTDALRAAITQSQTVPA